jgi:RNA polymerase sigma-70 factor, ECF subfamily
MSRLPFPSAEEGRGLHRRLLDKDPVAPKEVCERFAEPLLASLLVCRADEQACGSAVGETLMGYVQRPEMFDPEALDLAAFLRMAARRDLSNRSRAEARHHRGREPDFRVEVAGVCGNHFEDDPAASSVRGEEKEAARCRIEAVREECDPSERLVLDSMLEGERSTERIAARIGAAHLPEEDRRRAVKRVKDRIKKRLGRKGGTHGEPVGRDGRAEPA